MNKSDKEDKYERLMSYSNKDRKAVYRIFKDSDYTIRIGDDELREEVIDSVRKRLMTFNNPVMLTIIKVCRKGKDFIGDLNFEKVKEKLIWYIENHPNEFFDEFGDWLPNVEQVAEKYLEQMCSNIQS